MSDTKSIYTDGQLRKIAVVYDALARFLPTEGRDYGVKIGFHGENDTMSISMEPYTPLGKFWCNYCMNIFKNSKESV